MRSTYRYFISLVVCCCAMQMIQAQQTIESTANNDSIKRPWFNGIMINLDVAPLVTTFTGNRETFSYEGAVQINIRNKYFPVIEGGYAGADRTSASGIGFQAQGAFYRLGLDINPARPKKDAKPGHNLFLAGLRLGYSNFTYDLNNAAFPDTYWGDGTVKNIQDIRYSKLWYEITAGIRVEIAKNLYLGWTVKMKNRFKEDNPGDNSPWYIPGYGINTSGMWGFNYLIGYKF